MIHLYAFTYPGMPLPAIEGIGGSKLDLHELGAVAAVSSSVEEGLEREDVVAHGLVVEALRELGDAVLPVRFGERFADRAALHEAVGKRAHNLRAQLDRVRGCSEFGVRLLALPAPAEPARAVEDGGAYLRARLASLQESTAVAAELHRPLTAFARATVVAPGGDHTAAYLVAHEQRAAFEAELASFMAAHPDVTVVCTGPWAPYSFAEAA